MRATIRTAVPGDLPAMLPIEQEAFGVTAWSAGQLADELARVGDTRWYAVAVADREVIGYAGLYLSPPDADIQTIAVAAARRGRGVSRHLLTAAIEYAWAQGCTRMFLEVREDNAAALGLYDSLGFVRMRRRPRYYADGAAAITMRLRRSEVPSLGEAGHG